MLVLVEDGHSDSYARARARNETQWALPMLVFNTLNLDQYLVLRVKLTHLDQLQTLKLFFFLGYFRSLNGRCGLSPPLYVSQRVLNSLVIKLV